MLRSRSSRAALAIVVGLLAMSASAPMAQDGRSVLQIKVAVIGPGERPMPVPRHVLLISDNPPTAAPRRVQTGADGSASVRLPAGNYTIESDQPVTFQGKAYQWVQTIDVAAGRDVVLELTAANAEVEAASTVNAAGTRSLEGDESSLLIKWQGSVFTVWSPTGSASGFVVDRRGLVVTHQKAIGTSSSAEVQIAAGRKFPARVLAADAVRDVAVLWIDPQSISTTTTVPLGCGTPVPQIKDRQEIVALGAPPLREKRASAGVIYSIDGRALSPDFPIGAGTAGGPVFARDGHVIGISSFAEEDAVRRRRESRVIRVEEICAVVSAAESTMKDGAAPAAVPLPVEPERPFPAAALDASAKATAFSLTPYRLTSSSYDITFITPVLLHAGRVRAQQASGRTGGQPQDPRTIDPLDEFSNWTAYVNDTPPVLMIRATPRLVEGFWTKVARGAAQTQGMALPPIKRFKPGFGRLQAFCGDREITPIHPLKIEQRVTETDAVYEGLYVFDPAAIGPACGPVKIVLYSEKDAKGDSRAVDPKIVERVWADFEPYRAQSK